MADKPKKNAPAKASSANNSNGFVVVSKTTITTMQNSKGVKRTVRETTSAPKKQAQAIDKKPAVSKKQPSAPARKK